MVADPHKSNLSQSFICVSVWGKGLAIPWFPEQGLNLGPGSESTES